MDSTATNLESVSNYSVPAGASVTIYPKLEAPGLYHLELLFKIPDSEEDDEDDTNDEDNWDMQRFYLEL